MNPKFDKMLGFSTEDVRAMLLYYKEAGMLPAESDVEAIITEMEPWYDNYCFAKECLKQEARVFNCDMVLYYLRQYMDSGHSPERMVDPNTKTDYNKLKKLLQLDRWMVTAEVSSVVSPKRDSSLPEWKNRFLPAI